MRVLCIYRLVLLCVLIQLLLGIVITWQAAAML
jgi:hypothetical protein